MKFKSFIVFILITLIIFLIYIFNIDKKIYYVNITEEDVKYNNYIKNKLNDSSKLEKYINYNNKNYRVTDLINDINNNKKIDNINIQNALIKADLLTIKIGANELNYKANSTNLTKLYEYTDEFIKDIEQLFTLLRKYDKEKIFFIGIYNSNSTYLDEVYKYINLKIQDLCMEYDIYYIENNNLKHDRENLKVGEKVLKYLHLKI
ncbi:MAG: hypothetical protein J6G98_01450 [Bacilli bacterium]|nr:hypothetical protein [Bacilli bacterium]